MALSRLGWWFLYIQARVYFSLQKELIVTLSVQEASMQLEDLRQIHDGYDHIYLSPHLDDAALSCGGAIARHANAGARVLVVTLCTAAPPPAGPFSDFANAVHQSWGLASAEVVRARLREDD